VNTMPEATLKALAGHTQVDSILAADGGDCETVLGQFERVGIDVDALGPRLQTEGVTSFIEAWDELMWVLASKADLIRQAG